MEPIQLLSVLAVLASFTVGVEIQCNYEIKNYGYGDFYACNATVINVENAATVTSISGDHMTGKGNADVKGFVIFYHKILTKIRKA